MAGLGRKTAPVLLVILPMIIPIVHTAVLTTGTGAGLVSRVKIKVHSLRPQPQPGLARVGKIKFYLTFFPGF